MAFWAAILPFLAAAAKGVATKGAATAAAKGIGGAAAKGAAGGAAAQAGAGGLSSMISGAGMQGVTPVLSQTVAQGGGPLLKGKTMAGSKLGSLLGGVGGQEGDEGQGAGLSELMQLISQSNTDPERTPPYVAASGGGGSGTRLEKARGSLKPAGLTSKEQEGGLLQGPTTRPAANTLDQVQVDEGGENILSRIWGNPMLQGTLDFLGTTSRGGNVFQGIDAVEEGQNQRAFNKYLDKQLEREDLSQQERDRYMAARKGGQKLTLSGGVTQTQAADARTRRADYDWYAGLDESGRRRAEQFEQYRVRNATKSLPGETDSAYRRRLERLYNQGERGPGRSEAPAEPAEPTERDEQEAAESAQQWGFGESPGMSEVRKRLEERYPSPY